MSISARPSGNRVYRDFENKGVEMDGFPTIYNPYVISGPIDLGVVGDIQKGASAILTLTANGVSTPTFTGLTQTVSSSGWDNRMGIINIVQIARINDVNYLSITQASGAVPSLYSGELIFNTRTANVQLTSRPDYPGITYVGTGVFSNCLMVSDYRLPGNGSYSVQLVDSNFLIGVKINPGLESFNAFSAFIWASANIGNGGTYFIGHSGGNILNSLVLALPGDTYGIERVGSVFTLTVRRAGATVNASTITSPFSGTANMYLACSINGSPTPTSAANIRGVGVTP